MSNYFGATDHKRALDRKMKNIFFMQRESKKQQPPKPTVKIEGKHMTPYLKPCKNPDCKRPRRPNSAFCGQDK